MKDSMYTRWGRALSPEHVLQEYPRPGLVRESYLNLNGTWEYAFTKTEKLPDRYEGQILVPFSPEAPLSGVNRQLQPDEVLHYKRVFRIEASDDDESESRDREAAFREGSTGERDVRVARPAGVPKRRWLLHFGAVDQMCSVYVDHRKVGSHTGGYLPFTFDVTDAVKAPGQNAVMDGDASGTEGLLHNEDASGTEGLLHNGDASGTDGSLPGGESCAQVDHLLQVVVKDLSDTSYHAKGKQSLVRGGMWYTAQSGIWQTVWMEEVPEHYISDLKITPDYDQGSVALKVFTNHPERRAAVHATVLFKGEVVGEWNFQSDRTAMLQLGGPGSFESWTPEHPNLYDLKIEMGDDTVTSYFGMRKYSVGRDAQGVPRFFLNNEPYFHNGLLDQGYWPDGLYTAPSDEALCYDIQAMKDLGFNMLRKHIKIEPARWYYHCDRLGMLVWQDMVCGGDRYRSWFVTYMPNLLPWTGRVISDHHYGLFARRNAQGRREFRRELKETIRHLYNYPCISVWVPFNEGWGQFNASGVTKDVRRLDPSRLIDEASGWFDQGGGDVYSIHNYWRKLRVSKPRVGKLQERFPGLLSRLFCRPSGKGDTEAFPRSRVVALTECGGYSYREPEHSLCEEVYGYRKYSSREELTDGIAMLWEKELIPNVSRGLGGTVYTQVSDVEDEVNGLLTYDREVCKVDAARMQAVNRRLLAEQLQD